MKISRILLATTMVASAIVAAACSGGSSDDSSTPTVPTSPTPACTPITDTSLSHLQTVIFSPTCGEGQAGNGCHDTNQALSNNFVTTAGNTRANSVNVQSVGTITTNGGVNNFHIARVLPGDHPRPFLWIKAVGTDGRSGTPMPSGQPNPCQ